MLYASIFLILPVSKRATRNEITVKHIPIITTPATGTTKLHFMIPKLLIKSDIYGLAPKYDAKEKKAYLEYPDGRREYVE